MGTLTALSWMMVAGCLAADPSIHTAVVDQCLAAVRTTAAACACPQGGLARWIDDERCVCDEASHAEACGTVVARAPGRGVLVVPGRIQLGFTTLLRDFFGHLARACAAGEHLLYDGFVADSHKDQATRLPPEAFFSLEKMNAALQAEPGCVRTQVLPRSCALAGRRLVNATRCDRNIDWGKDAAALHLANTLPLDLAPAVAAARPRVIVPAVYDAVHFNLDCDWLLYLERRNGTRNRLRRGWASKTEALCGGGDIHIKDLGSALAQSYAQATSNVAGDAPWLVVTSIGKPGHAATRWVLDSYKRALPNLVFFMTGSRSRYREVNAAAELGVLLGARNFVGLWHSTFSNFAAHRLHRPSNGSEASLICKCLTCCLAGESPLSGRRRGHANE